MKKVLFMFMLLFFTLCINSKENVDGIYYNLNTSNNTASVTNNSNYSGEIIIPEKITIGGTEYTVTSIEDFAFFECNQITSVVLPSTIKEIGMNAFKNCKLMTTINLSEGIEKIGEQAFRGCEAIETINLPGSVADCGTGLFMDCKSLKSITIGEGFSTIGESFFMRCAALESIVIPNSVKSIDARAFYSCTSLKSAIIGENVSNIGESAFYSCSSLKEIIIPSKVTTIGKQAFAYCNEMERITFGENVKEIGKGVIENCQTLAAIRCKAIEPANVMDEKLLDQYTLTILYIPEGTEEAYKNANVWSDFIVLKEISDSEVINDKLDDFDIDGIRYIGSKGMNTAKVVKKKDGLLYEGNVVIPATVNYEGCNYDVKYIDNNTFEYCKALTNIELPESIISIGNWAFSGCIYLEAIKIPNSVKHIGESTFFACNYIKEIYIPAGIESIGDWAFSGCLALKDIYSAAENPIDITGYTFEYRNDQILHVPTGCKENYANKEFWSNFENIKEFDFLGIDKIDLIDTNDNIIYDLQGHRINNPTKGLYIKNGKKIIL